MQRIANFIDHAYFWKLREYFGRPRINYGELARTLAGEAEILRTYLYDSLPYVDNHSTSTQRDHRENKRRFLSNLSRISRFEVRFGETAYRGNDADGKPVYVQKRVDVRQSVDLVALATKRLITEATFLAGDSDFIPAIEVAKNEGVLIRLYHGASAHKDLIALCDERTCINKDFFQKIGQFQNPAFAA
jgi:uncharacterized LabA/DUF88 family protein